MATPLICLCWDCRLAYEMSQDSETPVAARGARYTDHLSHRGWVVYLVTRPVLTVRTLGLWAHFGHPDFDLTGRGDAATLVTWGEKLAAAVAAGTAVSLGTHALGLLPVGFSCQRAPVFTGPRYAITPWDAPALPERVFISSW